MFFEGVLIYVVFGLQLSFVIDMPVLVLISTCLFRSFSMLFCALDCDGPGFASRFGAIPSYAE